MSQRKKIELMRELALRERIVKGKLQYYVKFRLQIREGTQYADDQINACLDELRQVWDLIKKLENHE
jgi:hypothetical protein